MRDTPYATEIATASDEWGHTIERLFIKGQDREEIRFSYWKDGNITPRPLDLGEDDLLELIGRAIEQSIFSDDFLRGLQTMLNGHLGGGETG